jgi:hypothetical protein
LKSALVCLAMVLAALFLVSCVSPFGKGEAGRRPGGSSARGSSVSQAGGSPQEGRPGGAGSSVCGRGDCVADRSGNFACSASRGGSARVNASGEADCDGGCVVPNAAFCPR